jgi:DNA-binding Lrp family transcriptional regulator
MQTISYDEWQEALAETHQSDEGQTTAELCELLNLSVNTLRKRIRKAEAEGRLTKGRRYERDVAGRIVPKTVYRIVPRAPKGRARRAV